MRWIVESQIPIANIAFQLRYPQPRESDSQVLQKFRKPEALDIVDLVGRLIIDIDYPCKGASKGQKRVDVPYDSRSTFQVLRVARDTPRVKVGLHDFRAQDIIRGGDPEAVLVIESELVIGRGPSTISRFVPETLRAEPGPEFL